MRKKQKIKCNNVIGRKLRNSEKSKSILIWRRERHIHKSRWTEWQTELKVLYRTEKKSATAAHET